MVHQEYRQYIQEHLGEAASLLRELGRIPSPSNHEEKRAEYVLEWFRSIGAGDAYIDDAMNVIWPVGVEESNPVTVFSAHTDVVFPDTDPLPMEEHDGRIYCPGIGDDTANLVGLLMAARYIAERRLLPSDGAGFLFVANSGEEGLGNLRGSRKICETFGKRIRFYCSLDGYIGMLCTEAVGSERYRVEVLTEGGHSYGDFGNRNAIAYLAGLIDTLYQLVPPQTNYRTTYNVGKVSGGTSVNTIAQQAEMLYEYRSDSRDDLEFMRRHFEAAVESFRAKGIRINVERIGERPCSRDVDREQMKRIEESVRVLIRETTGAEASVQAMSTDCNIPLSHGIPSVCTGVIAGSGMHKRGEYIELGSMLGGYHLAMELVLSCFMGPALG